VADVDVIGANRAARPLARRMPRPPGLRECTAARAAPSRAVARRFGGNLRPFGGRS